MQRTDHDPEPRPFARPDARKSEQWSVCAHCENPIVRRLSRKKDDGEAVWSEWRHA
jgi:hypothetical protein